MSQSKKGKILGCAAFLLLSALAVFYILYLNEPESGEQSTATLDNAIAMFHQKKYDEALAAFETVPDNDPQKWRALYYQGSAYIMLKDYQNATKLLEQSLESNPTNTKVMHALGVAYFKLGNLKLSKAYFASVLEIDPNDAEAKGLMDIMANLENQQVDASRADAEPESEDSQQQ